MEAHEKWKNENLKLWEKRHAVWSIPHEDRINHFKNASDEEKGLIVDRQTERKAWKDPLDQEKREAAKAAKAARNNDKENKKPRPVEPRPEAKPDEEAQAGKKRKGLGKKMQANPYKV